MGFEQIGNTKAFKERLKAFQKIYGKAPFYNAILGYFKTEKEMDDAIKESGIVLKKGCATKTWAIPLIKSIREKTVKGFWKRGDPVWVVGSQYEAYKKKVWARRKALEENEEAMDTLVADTSVQEEKSPEKYKSDFSDTPDKELDVQKIPF